MSISVPAAAGIESMMGTGSTFRDADDHVRTGLDELRV